MAIPQVSAAQVNNTPKSSDKVKTPWSTKDKVALVVAPALMGGTVAKVAFDTASDLKTDIVKYNKFISDAPRNLQSKLDGFYKKTPEIVEKFTKESHEMVDKFTSRVAKNEKDLSKLGPKAAVGIAVAVGAGILLACASKALSDKNKAKKAQKDAEASSKTGS